MDDQHVGAEAGSGCLRFLMVACALYLLIGLLVIVAPHL